MVVLAPEGIEHRAATRTVDGFSLTKGSEYHQKYHHFLPHSPQYGIGCPEGDYVGLLPTPLAFRLVL